MMSTTSERPSPCSGRRDERTTCTAWILRGSGVLLLGGSAFAQALVNGGVASGTLSAPGERDTYTFDAHTGNRFELRLVDVDASTFTPRLELYDPAGVLTSSSTSPDVAVIDTRKAGRSGTYTVVVSNASDDARNPTGAYTLHFVLVPGANAGGELLDGLTVFGEVERGDLDSFTFTTVGGQQYEGTITPLYGSTLRLRVEWMAPHGGYSVGIGGSFHFIGTSDPGGINTLVLSDASSAATGTGGYSIVVHGVAAVPPYPPSVFWRSEYSNDPLLMDDGGNAGLGPRIGDPREPFNFSIDCTRADSPSIYALSLTADMQSAASTPRGWLYLYGPTLLRKVGRHMASVESWFPEPAGFPVPNDLSLVGTTYTVQGACGGFAGSMRLSGAITQTIGN